MALNSSSFVPNAFICFACVVLFTNLRDVNCELYANQWAVYMKGGMKLANKVASEHGFRNMGPVGMLKDVYFFTHLAVPKRHRRSTIFRNTVLERDSRVSLVVQQKIKKRVKRDASSLRFTDSSWKDQWYLHRTDPGMHGHDMNILPVWKKGITGKNVVVTILDDGIENTHRELRRNYDKNASYDYNDNDPDPQPKWALESSQHGTRCAAQVAAEANNSYCIIGVAYNARIGGIRMLDGDVTDLIESSSLMHKRDYIDIYSASWGPEDDGLTVDGPGNLTKKALEEGVKHGRGGKGSIFVWASGNGGNFYDDCNCDGYTNSIYTISAAAATSSGDKPWYLEECSSTLVSSYGSGEYKINKKIFTADLNGGCTDKHSGTSVAAPFVAGFVALALEVNSKLTWRDVQHLLVRTSNMENLNQSNVRLNGAKRKFSPTFGFGVLDGGALVDLAAKWSLVSEQHVCKTQKYDRQIPVKPRRPLIINIDMNACKGTKNFIRYLEHVHIIITLIHNPRGEASIYLVSAMGTRSRVLGRRKKDYKKKPFENWAFLSTHFWGENPMGQWKLEIHSNRGEGYLSNWQLVLYGSEFAPGEPLHGISGSGHSFGKKGTKCHKECLGGCTGPNPYECSRCRNYQLVDRNKTCVDWCPGNYFTDDIAKLCLPCHDSCWSCSGPNSQECLSCKAGKILYENECIDKCPSDFFKAPHDIGFRCLRCDGSCLRCSGTAENCTLCKPEDILVKNHCVARCDHESYFDGINCIPCDRSCHTCNGKTSANCTSCRYKGLHENMNLKTMYLYQGRCLSKCPVSYYGDQFKGFCEPCGKNCLRCEAEGTRCTVCRFGYFRLPNRPNACVKECLQGQYPDLSLGVCRPCSHDCLTCLPGRPFECTSCGTVLSGQPIFLKESKCVFDINCGPGFFGNKSSGRCDVCPFPCATCKAHENCQTCFDHYVNINDERCIDQCPGGTYRDLERKCMNCNPNCQECFGPGKKHCRRCHLGMVLLPDNSCSWFCPEGFYRDVEAQLCRPCAPPCLQCYGPNVNQCVKCIKNLDLRGTTCVQPCVDNYLTENSCEPCNKHCKTCYGPERTECLSCYANKTLFNYRCMRKCPSGFYKDKDELCRPCHRHCSVCDGKEATNCLSCSLGLSLLNGTCVRKCPKGYFQQDAHCLKCSSNCAECQYSEDICFYCKEGKVWQDFVCHDSCSEGKFVLKETRKCAKCHPTCRTCSGFDANQCLSCWPGSILYDSTCYEECPARYIAEAPTKICNECPEDCLRCSETSNFTVCENCRHPYLNFHGHCVKTCPGINYFHDYYTKSCQRCHESCEICFGPSQSDCIVCKKNFRLVGNKCIISNCSKDTYLDSKTSKCLKCDPKCKSCTGPSNNECTECLGEYVLHQNSCILGCNDGRYPEESLGSCLLCHASCKSCIGPSNGNCTACKKDHTLINGECILGCKEGLYPDEGSRQCRHCHPSCRSCSGPKSNHCTACRRQHMLLDDTCVLSCSEGLFPDKRLDKCQKCNRVCKTCDGPTMKNCTTCSRDFSLVEGTCVLDCAEGSYPDFKLKQCQHCHALCKTCNSPLPSNCTSCKKEFTLIENKCILDCSEGRYPDESTHQCKHCSINCKTCHGPTHNNCTACHKEYTLVDGKCVLDCPSGKYADASIGKCRHCNTMCKSCNGSSPKNCTSCKTRYSLIDGACVLFCDEGSYPDERIGVCLSCHKRCRSCSGSSKNECLGCREGYFLEDNKCLPECYSDAFYDEPADKCVQCMHPCSSCYGANFTDCLSCESGFELAENTCYPKCKDDEYLDEKNRKCIKCDDSCESCFGKHRSNCTRCKNGYILFDDTCFMICEDGSFPNYRKGHCEQCHDMCSVCNGPSATDCSSCKEGYSLTHNGCALVCKPGTFSTESALYCQNCYPKCKTCNGPSKQSCTSCYGSALLTNGSCVLNCADGTYIDGPKSKCVKCHSTCKTCVGKGSGKCTSCNDGFRYINSTCRLDCSTGTYLNTTAMRCQNCSETCRSCIGPSLHNCTLCQDGYTMIGNTCKLDCEGNSYLDDASMQCRPCDETCKSCNGPEKNDCTSCREGYRKVNNACVLTCPSGSYVDHESNSCKECDAPCSGCLGANSCTSCKGNGTLLNGKCILVCANGYYPHKNSFMCLKCDATCKSCSGPAVMNCTACYEKHTLAEDRCIKNCTDGFYLDISTLTCQRCIDFCKTCQGPMAHDCLLCISGFYMQNGSCVQSCSEGYYLEDQTCKMCDDNCAKCLGHPEICTACKSGYLKQGDTCVRNCSIGRYFDQYAKECLKCDEMCEICDGPNSNNCISCKPELLMDRTTKSCVTECKSKHYTENGECLPCHDTCSSCNGPLHSDCSLCSGILIMHNSVCIDKCPEGYYEFEAVDISVCRKCSDKCRLCSGGKDNECTSCKRGLYLQGSNCTATCSSPHVAKNDMMKCELPLNVKPSLRKLQEFDDGGKKADVYTSFMQKIPLKNLLILLLVLTVCFLLFKSKYKSRTIYRPAGDPKDCFDAETVPWTERKTLKKTRGGV